MALLALAALLLSAAGTRVAALRRLDPWPKAAARITAPNGHALADARLGGELAVAWEVPEGFVPAEAALTGWLRAEGALCAVDARPALVSPQARAAVILWPATCAGHAVRPAKRGVGDPPAEISLRLADAEGRTVEVRYAFW